MIQFDRIELATYPNKPLDTVVIKGWIETNHKNLKKN